MLLFFFFNDTATTEIYTLSLHDALPISYAFFWNGSISQPRRTPLSMYSPILACNIRKRTGRRSRSEEHTSELQSQSNLVCRLLLEKKNTHRLPGPRVHATTSHHGPAPNT